MRGKRLGARLRRAVLVLLLLSGSVVPVRAAEKKESLHEQLLALNRLSGDDAVNGRYRALLDHPRAAKKLLAVAKTMVKDKAQPFNYNTAFILAHLAEEFKDLDAAETFYRVCVDWGRKLESGRKLSQAFVSLIALFYDNQKYEASARACKEFLEFKTDDGKPRIYYLATEVEEEGEPVFVELESYDPLRRHKPSVHRLMIQAIAKQGKFDEASKLVETLIKANPRDWLDLQLKGWVLREAGKYREAARIYEDVLEKINADKELEAAEKEPYLEKYRYALSTIYIDLNQVDKASAALKELLAKKPNNPTYNNDLGYIWADHDMNLPEAEKLIRKALEEDRKLRKKENLKPEEDRDNGAYLDSLGWVLYKQKKYKEAREALEKAVEDKESQHIEIYDHLGDVYSALGEKERAIEAWKKGLGFVTSSKRDQERKALVEQKLKANK
jgi:tetratricopeptide (TPR) repeat protein